MDIFRRTIEMTTKTSTAAAIPQAMAPEAVKAVIKSRAKAVKAAKAAVAPALKGLDNKTAAQAVANVNKQIAKEAAAKAAKPKSAAKPKAAAKKAPAQK